MFTVFAAATPGMRELLSIGKVWELAQEARRTPGGKPYDLVILDAPASGHGVAILEAPRTFAGAARVGTVARQGRTIHAMLADPARTGVIAVAAPEEMPVNETIALRRGVARADGARARARGRQRRRAFALQRRRGASGCAGDSEPVRAAPLAPRARPRAPQPAQRGCAAGSRASPCTTLPRLHVADIDAPQLELLAGRLERVL